MGEKEPIHHAPQDPQWEEVQGMIQEIKDPDVSQAGVEYHSREEQIQRTRQHYTKYASFLHDEVGMPASMIKEIFTRYTVFQANPPEESR